MTRWPLIHRVPVRAGVAIVLAALVGFVAAAAATRQPTRTFSRNTGMIFNYIRADRTDDFEAVMRELAEAIAGSDDAERRRQASGWRVYRAQEPGPNNEVLYIMLMDPAVPGAEYSVAQILAEERPADVQSLYERFSGAFAETGQSIVNLEQVVEF
jgi:hypothetical protein